MRMAASWYLPLGRPNTSSWRAMRARWRAPLGIVVDLNKRGHDCRVVPTEQVWRCARARQGQVAARWPSATQRRSALRPSKIRWGRGDVAGPIEQEDAAHNTIDSNRPIQVHERIVTVGRGGNVRDSGYTRAGRKAWCPREARIHRSRSRPSQGRFAAVRSGSAWRSA
jgi:hypothetical protein